MSFQTGSYHNSPIDVTTLLKQINSTMPLSAIQGAQVNTHNTITIRITNATGGSIVEIVNNGGEISNEVYVVDESKDIGVELGKIITMHHLKKA